MNVFASAQLATNINGVITLSDLVAASDLLDKARESVSVKNVKRDNQYVQLMDSTYTEYTPLEVTKIGEQVGAYIETKSGFVFELPNDYVIQQDIGKYSPVSQLNIGDSILLSGNLPDSTKIFSIGTKAGSNIPLALTEEYAHVMGIFYTYGLIHPSLKDPCAQRIPVDATVPELLKAFTVEQLTCMQSGDLILLKANSEELIKLLASLMVFKEKNNLPFYLRKISKLYIAVFMLPYIVENMVETKLCGKTVDFLQKFQFLFFTRFGILSKLDMNHRVPCLEMFRHQDELIDLMYEVSSKKMVLREINPPFSDSLVKFNDYLYAFKDEVIGITPIKGIGFNIQTDKPEINSSIIAGVM